MAIFVSMLRGINVTGHRKIRMAELRKAYEELGFSRVESYLQSGNVVFDGGRKTAAAIVKLIEKEIASRFGHDVSVILRTPAELAKIVDRNPFLSRRGVDPAKLHVTFLPKASGKSSPLASAETRSRKDEFVVVGREVFLHCPDGYGRTKFTNDFFERRLKTRTTTRNWRTVNALLEMSAPA